MTYAGPDIEGDLARNIRAIRERRRMSQEDLARAMSDSGCRWHQATVYKVETGQRRVRLAEAVSLAENLDVALGVLVAAPPDREVVETLSRLVADLNRIESDVAALVDEWFAAWAKLLGLVSARDDLDAAPPDLRAAWRVARDAVATGGAGLEAALIRARGAKSLESDAE